MTALISQHTTDTWAANRRRQIADLRRCIGNLEDIRDYDEDLTAYGHRLLSRLQKRAARMEAPA